MSFLHMAFPPRKSVSDRKSISSETTEMRDGGGGFVFEEEEGGGFWPVEHPIEPPQGEKPVECPLPHSSVIHEWRVSRRFLPEKVPEPTSKRRHSVSHDRRSFLFNDKSQPRKSFSTYFRQY